MKVATVEGTLQGLGLSEMHYEDMSVLIKTELDMNDLMDNYWIREDKQFESINKYRNDKIENNPITYDSFEGLYKAGDKVSALESLFWHKVHKGHVRMLEKRFASGTLDLRKLYDWQRENKKCRLLRLVIQTTY